MCVCVYGVCLGKGCGVWEGGIFVHENICSGNLPTGHMALHQSEAALRGCQDVTLQQSSTNHTQTHELLSTGFLSYMKKENWITILQFETMHIFHLNLTFEH